MKLTGEVILDTETMDQLKEEIREQVITEIAEKGARICELEQMIDCLPYTRYSALLFNTIFAAADKVREAQKNGEIKFDDERRACKQILAIESVLAL